MINMDTNRNIYRILSGNEREQMELRLNWVNVTYFSLLHLLGFIGIYYMIFVHFSLSILYLFLILTVAGSFSITGGYHRYFSHKSYKCTSLLKVYYLLIGAASMQNSAITWAQDHRIHHAYTDKEQDPYSIMKGFWWAHMGWVFYKRSGPKTYSHVHDLFEDKLTSLQHDYYIPLGIALGFIIPMSIGAIMGDLLGGFLVAACLRLVVQYHSTWSVNSFAHKLGSQPYGRNDSSRNSLVTALLTLGEGNNHNYHHRFPSDSRNGVRWYDFDPTKWLIWIAAKLNLAYDLRITPEKQIKDALIRATNT
jgi:stearoyl-CoA desaturase (Delta-9 desaturase)